MVGDYISSGATGWVFEHNREPDKVIKIMKAFPRVGKTILDAFQYDDYLLNRFPDKYNAAHRDYDHEWATSLLWRPMSAKMLMYVVEESMSYRLNNSPLPSGLPKVYDAIMMEMPLRDTKDMLDNIESTPDSEGGESFEENFLNIQGPGHRNAYITVMEKLRVPENRAIKRVDSRLRPRVEVFKEVANFLWNDLGMVTRDTANAGNYGFRANGELVIFDPIVAPLPVWNDWSSSDVYDRLRYNYFSYLFTEEPFPIDSSHEAKPVNRQIRTIEKQLNSGTFDTVERSAEGLNYRPAQREWYNVVAYPTSTDSSHTVDLADHMDVMSALAIFKGACEKNYYTVEMYRNRSIPVDYVRDQKTLVLKCKYNYITGNDRQFLKFVESYFDKKWRFQAEFEVEGFPGSVDEEIQIADWSVQDLMYSNSITGNFLEDQAKFNYGLNAEDPDFDGSHPNAQGYPAFPKNNLCPTCHKYSSRPLRNYQNKIMCHRCETKLFKQQQLEDPAYIDNWEWGKYGKYLHFEAPAAPKVKFPRAKADKIVAEVEAHMKPMVDKIMACGSYRRGAQMIGDIDFVLIPKAGYTLPNMLPPNQGVNWVGENKAQVIIDGEKVDFKVTTPDAWGATIMYFTGPADFNIKYRTMAKKQGKKLNEYGVWDRINETYLAGKTEADVFTELGRPYKEPKDRKGWAWKKAETFGSEGESHPRCPICFGYIPNDLIPGRYPGALARYDNQTEICSDCGTVEALVGMFATPEQIVEWQDSDQTFDDYRILIMNVKHNVPELMFGRGPEVEALRKLNKDKKNSESLNEQMFQQRYGWNVGEEDNLALRQSDTPMAINLGEHNYYQPFRGLGSLFGAESSGDKVFGVQRHDAHRAGLHYDLRLERDGVLKSWSIPKGMPTDKRHLAIETPDHKMSWLDFEGEIKEGYGAGSVKLDSKSTFKTISYKPKKWVFYVNSGKYQGKYTLVHWKDNKWLISRNKNQSLAAENTAPTREQQPGECVSCGTKRSQVWSPDGSGFFPLNERGELMGSGPLYLYCLHCYTDDYCDEDTEEWIHMMIRNASKDEKVFNAWYDLATEKQRNYIKRLGGDPHPDLNRRQASKLINQLAREKKALDQIDIVAEEE